jgi:hypothetical protein
MNHKINVTLAGKIIGTAQVSESGEVVADIDYSLVPERLRPKVTAGMFSLAPEEGKAL